MINKTDAVRNENNLKRSEYIINENLNEINNENNENKNMNKNENEINHGDNFDNNSNNNDNNDNKKIIDTDGVDENKAKIIESENLPTQPLSSIFAPIVAHSLITEENVQENSVRSESEIILNTVTDYETDVLVENENVNKDENEKTDKNENENENENENKNENIIKPKYFQEALSVFSTPFVSTISSLPLTTSPPQSLPLSLSLISAGDSYQMLFD